MDATWDQSDEIWDLTPYTWDDIQLAEEVVEEIQKGAFIEEIFQDQPEKLKQLITLTLKIKGETLTESKTKTTHYKLKAEDIRLVVKEVIGVELTTENISF